MAKSSKLRIMISSRCNDRFPNNATGRPLSEIRLKLKEELESTTVLGRDIFEVWINEVAPPKSASWDSWDTCMEHVRDCDMLIALCNGNAGWAENGGEIGICHAELMTGLSESPGKVRLISLGNIDIGGGVDGERNRLFQEYVRKQSLFRGGTVSTDEQLYKRIKEAIHDSLVSLSQLGVREASRGSFHRGDALDWSRLDYQARRKEMQSVLRDSIVQRAGSYEDNQHVLAKFANTDVLLVPDAVPAAMTIGYAKEMVGQPFLRDHQLAPVLGKSRGGPLHIIGCHKTATESQAIKMLGFPDATVVNTPFGVFVADEIQKVQFAFIVNCRDDSTTRHGVQRFFEWLSQTGEEEFVAKRAKARARIVAAIAKEVVTSS